MYAMLGNAHAASKFITPIIINIVTMQRRNAKKNRYDTMHVMLIISAVMFKSKRKKPRHFTYESHQ